MPDRSKTLVTGIACPLAHGSAGLCETCRNARVIEAQTGSRFYRCLLARTDQQYAKYPRIPVLHCTGFAPFDSQRNSG